MPDLKDVIQRMKELQNKYCRDSVDDGEEMFIDMPEFLNWAIPILEEEQLCSV